jgi:putative endopeptidase
VTELDTHPPALDLSGVDTAIRIQDDLFRHVNGSWLDNVKIPADQPSTGAFIRLRDAAEEAVQQIITGLDNTVDTVDSKDTTGNDEPATEEGKIATLYASFTDTETVDDAGMEPIAGLLNRVDAAADIPAFVRLLGELCWQNVDGLIDFDAEVDPGDPQRMVMFVGQGGIGLPDEQFYRLDEHAEIRAAYRQHLANSLRLAEIADADDQAQRVFDLETGIAAHHWDRVATRDLRAMYNLMSADQFESAAPELLWEEFLTGAGIEASVFAELVVQQPSFFAEVAGLLTTDRLPDWQAWLRWKIISSFSPYLSQPFVDEHFNFYGTVLNGVPQNKPRWKRGVALVEGALGEAVGKIYVERHFSAVAKQRIDDLVANLIEAYRQSIAGLDWMTGETKAKALDKLAKFTPKTGYPASWRDYSTLEIKPGDLVGNVIRAHAFEMQRSINKIGQPVDRDEWMMTPQTVNAYYHPLRNEIVFPAAILQPPFFNEFADDAVNYGGIGAVIGHEIGHGFDDQGSTCDGDGRLINWWTDADRSAFDDRTKALVAQYNVLEPAQTPGHHVDGELTLGENIGDLGGLTIAYQAYKIASGEAYKIAAGEAYKIAAGEADRIASDAEPEVINGLTGDQRLFFGWAQVWQTTMRDEAVRQRLATDPHSPAEFRCNQVVRNLGAFHAAFGVGPADELWLDPDRRVRIW